MRSGNPLGRPLGERDGSARLRDSSGKLGFWVESENALAAGMGASGCCQVESCCGAANIIGPVGAAGQRMLSRRCYIASPKNTRKAAQP